MCAASRRESGQRRRSMISYYCRSLFRRKTSDTVTDAGNQTRAALGPVPKQVHVVSSAHATISTSLHEDNTNLIIPTPDLIPTSARDEPPSEDLWSAAFREALEQMKEHTDIASFEGKSVAQLFETLEQMGEQATQEDALLRGVKCLRQIEVPLENFKLALDLATPLTNLEPTAMTVFGVVKSVTAIAISFAKADLDFAKQIGEMLNHMSYIDDCDTLGRRTQRSDIHKTLVLVYGKILEFYNAAFNILTMRGVKLLWNMMEKERVPEIVQDFLKHTETLHLLIANATLKITEDIKEILVDIEIYSWLGKEKMDRQSEYDAQLRELRRPESDGEESEASDSRSRSLSDQACEFLLTDTTFMAWYETSTNQPLLILGEMGCGKSVLIAFMIDELRRRNVHQLPQPKVCYYYCRDDGTGQAINIFSVLILQLLDQLGNGLKLTFYEWYKKKTESGSNPAKEESMLKEFLRKVIVDLDRPLYIIIDGLDECSKAARRELAKLSKSLAKANSRLKILLSSRPNGEILSHLDFMDSIQLVANAGRDRLIAQHMVDKQLYDLSDEVRRLVVESLSVTAQGSAIWTKMMIGLIELEGHTALQPTKHFLEKMALPTQLSELYDNMLSRCALDDSERRNLASLALRILSAVRRPLSISELASAVALGAAGRDVTTIGALGELVDEQRILGLIHPFIGRIDPCDTKRRQLRLVHQSVKEFVVERLGPPQTHSQDSASESVNTRLPIGQAAQHVEECILNICIRYLLLDEVGANNVFSDHEFAIEAMPQDIDLFDDTIDGAEEYTKDCTWEEWEANMIRYNPAERGFGEFFVYSSCHWVDHLSTIDTEHLPDLLSIERLCSAGSTRLYNWIEQNRRPECVVQARFPFDSTLYDPLSIIALYGSEAVLLDVLDRSSFGGDNYQTQTATKAADQVRQWCGPERLQSFLSGIAARIDTATTGVAVPKESILERSKSTPADLQSCCADFDSLFTRNGDAPEPVVWSV